MELFSKRRTKHTAYLEWLICQITTLNIPIVIKRTQTEVLFAYMTRYGFIGRQQLKKTMRKLVTYCSTFSVPDTKVVKMKVTSVSSTVPILRQSGKEHFLSSSKCLQYEIREKWKRRYTTSCSTAPRESLTEKEAF